MSCNAESVDARDGVLIACVSRYWIERAFEDGKGIAVSSQITRSVVGPDGTTILALSLLALAHSIDDGHGSW
uniref:Uncharacterized protein n=1 Tax=Candidatus Methanogaster sp. ANME-2c ERB4 TaxID=2759911 RepID=A0A7G9YLW5_9EURY|nr:hypothetical protein CMADCPIN_00029 [Methanosarcinales archaeon ANME-2c ERB4]